MATRTAAQEPPPPQLFVLGDSLSDVGNAAAIADFAFGKPLPPPSTIGLCNPADFYLHERSCEDLLYRKSRVSDGPVAVEHLAAYLKLGDLKPSLHFLPAQPESGSNYAVASAKARGRGREDLASQVDMLLIRHGPLLPADAVFVVMIGGNDAIDALQGAAFAPTAQAPTSSLPQASGAVVDSAVAAIAANVERLIDFGAARLIVANVPDLASLPAVRVRAGQGSDSVAVLGAASAISNAFNRSLDEALQRIAAKPRWLRAVRLARFDLAGELQTVQSVAASEGRNAQDACFDSETYRASGTAERRFHPDCAPAPARAALRCVRVLGRHSSDRCHPRRSWRGVDRTLRAGASAVTLNEASA